MCTALLKLKLFFANAEVIISSSFMKPFTDESSHCQPEKSLNLGFLFSVKSPLFIFFSFSFLVFPTGKNFLNYKMLVNYLLFSMFWPFFEKKFVILNNVFNHMDKPAAFLNSLVRLSMLKKKT